MATWVKIPFSDQWQNANDVNASGYVIKCYEPGTTTPISMAIDKNGSVTVATAALNADGIPEVSGNEVALYIDRDFKYAIYENATDASNDTNAFFGPIDNVKINDVVATLQADYWVDTYANFRTKLAAGTYSAGDVVKITNSGIRGDFVVSQDTAGTGFADNGGTIITEDGGTTTANDWYAQRVWDGKKANAEWFGAAINQDNKPAITAALAACDHVVINLTTCRVDSIIELNELKVLELAANTLLTRQSASSSDTSPVVWIKGSRASLIGQGQTVSRIKSENDTPDGVVLIGHEDMTQSHANVNWCTVSDLDLIGKQSQGNTTGSPTSALVIQNPEIGALTSYFHQIHRLRVSDANYGIWLKGWANANCISNIQGYRLGDETVLGGAFFYDNGALDNCVSNCFLHQSINCVGILLEEFDNTSTSGGQLHQTYASSYTGIVVEQSGASALGIKATDGTVNKSYFHVMHNASGGNSLDSGFIIRNNFIGLSSGASNVAYYTPTLTPESSGSITLDAAGNSLSYARTGNRLNIIGMLRTASVSSPTGTYITLSLPSGITVADLTDFAGRSGGGFVFNNSGTYSVNPWIAVETESSIRLLMDASTVGSVDDFYFDLAFNITI